MTKHVEFDENGFDILRYAAALSVMLLHYSSYMMILSENLSVRGAAVMDGTRRWALLFPGVVILFAMSGFLISASFERVGSRKEFFLRRVLRMYPELWICTIINLAVVCILVPKLLDKGVILWVLTQIVGIANTPECLRTFGTGSINGALWTVFTEIQLYIVLGIVYPYLKKMKTGCWAAFLAMLVAANVACGTLAQNLDGILPKLIERVFLPYALWFFIGVFCYQKRRKMLPVLRNASLPMVIAYLVIKSFPVELPGYYADITTGILLPFAVIGGGYCLPRIRLKPDLSYGMFLYHWIVLNIMVYYDLINKLQWPLGVVLYVSGTVIAAAVSCKLGRTLQKRLQSVFR